MSDDEQRIEYELIRQAVLAEIHMLDTKIAPTSADDKHVVIEGRLGQEGDEESEDDVEHYAFGLLYALTMLSFADARPRGVSGMHFEKDDEWTADDMLRQLRFQRGELHLYADYVRGRCMKTTVLVRRDGTFKIETVNRGEAATRWIAKLQGKKTLQLVQSGAARDDEASS
jgi:hypothetical protein